MGDPVTAGLGARIVEILERRTGIETTVKMATGETYAVLNVAWGRDMGAAWEHVTTNISPEVEGASLDFFLTDDVVRLEDPRTGETLWKKDSRAQC